MSFTKEKYSERRINIIYQMLLNEKETGNPKEYDITVDDMKVVSRTNDPEKFYNHEDFIQDDTKSLTITLYVGSSRRYTRYILLLKDEDTQQQALSGFEKSLDEKLNQERNKWEYELLKKENEELKKQIEESEEYAEGLTRKIEDLESQQEGSSNKLTNTLINLAGVYLANKPNALNGIPLIGDLLGNNAGKTIPQSNDQVAINNEGNCTFEKYKSEEPRSFTGEVGSDELAELQKALIPFFKAEYLDRVGEVVHYLFMYNEFIDQTIKVMEHAINSKEPAGKAA